MGTALALAIGLAATAYLEDRIAFLLFIPVVFVAATLGGLGPGLAATLLGVAGSVVLTWQQGGGDLASTAAFVAIGCMIGAGGEMFQVMRDRAVAVNSDLRSREAHLSSILATVPDAMVVIDERSRPPASW